MPLPDPDASRAVLIGTAAYRHLEPLPAVARNLSGFAALLCDPGGWGLPAAHCRVVLDPASADEILEPVHRAAREATDTLFVYYAGHAFFDDDLLLTLPGSEHQRLFRSVRFADLRREITAAGCGRAVVLDCAWAGAVPDAAVVADAASVPGGWLLTAGAGNSLAPAPHHSALTGELLTVLGRGIPDGPATIDTDALYLRVRHELRAKQRAEPQQRSRGQIRLIELARNRAAGAADAAEPINAARNRAAGDAGDPAEPIASDVDTEPYLRMTPAALAESVSALRTQGRAATAAAALAACGRVRPDQEVAAIMAALAGLRRPADVAAVAFAAAGRDPRELRRIYEILVELDQRALAIGLLKVVAVGLPERTARFVGALTGTPGDDPVPALLRAAVAAARQRPHRVIDLLDALLLDRREAAAELALGEAERVLPPADLAVVADALRDGGRDEQAHRLYGRAADAVVRRGPERIATIVAALHAGGAWPVGRSLARQAVAARAKAPPEHLVALLDAFAEAGLEDEVTDAIGALSGGLARPALDEVIRLLRDRDRAGIALRLSLAAVADRPVDDILRLVESLNEQGRPVDALNLLAHAAQVRSIADLDRLTAPGGPAARRVFAAVAEQPPERAAALYRAVTGGREQFRAELLRRTDAEVVAVAAELDDPRDLLHAAGRTAGLAVAAVASGQMGVLQRLAAVATPDELPAVLRAVLDGFPAPGDAETRIAALLAGLPRRAIAETVAFVGAADDGRHQAALTEAVAARPVAEVVTVTAAITRPDSVTAAHELLDLAARGPVRRVAELVEELRRRGERAHLRALVESFRVRHPDSPDVFKLASWLWALDEHDVAALAVRGRLWLGEAAVGDALACAVAELLHAYAISSARLDLAYPVLAETAAEELQKSYPIAGDEACLLVLSSPKLRKPTPVLFTQRAVHHLTGEQLAYTALGEVQVSTGRRNAVLLDRADGQVSWVMPTAAAAREVVDLLLQIKALADQLHENVRMTAQVLAAGPARGYEMEGEVT